MVGFLEIAILAVPLFLTTSLSFLNFLVFLRNYKQIEETTLLHIAVTFLFSTLIFTFLFIAVFLPPSIQLQPFLLANIIVWLLFLEIGYSYLSAFLNRSKEIERYLLPIFGAAVGSAILIAIKPDLYLFDITLNVELLVYITAFISLLYTVIRAIIRVNLVLDQFEGEEMKLLELSQLVLFLGACCMVYTFFTCFGWLVIKGISNFSLEIGTWEIIDWITYLNMPMYAAILLGALLRSFRIDFEKIDVPTILNVLDSPSESTK